MIDSRRQGKTQAYDNSADLLSILVESETYKGHDDLIRADIFAFFFAGMKTIQISSTNLIYYMQRHPEYKSKLLAEVLPEVEKA